MKIKKGMRALSLLLVMALLGAVLVPAVSAESFHKIKEDTAPVVAIKDDDIRETVKGVIIEIDNSDLEQKEKTQYITELNEIISENPISKDLLEETLQKTGEALFSQEPPITP